jgi:hypothetical protein
MTKALERRKIQTTVSLSPRQIRYATEEAKRQQISLSDIVRRLIDREIDREIDRDEQAKIRPPKINFRI